MTDKKHEQKTQTKKKQTINGQLILDVNSLHKALVSLFIFEPISIQYMYPFSCCYWIKMHVKGIYADE